jgi:site-specific recombinase XerD
MRSPDQLTEQDIRNFFLYLINEKRLSPSTVKVYLCGTKFFFERTLRRKWPVFDLLRASKREKLPTVLTIEEVRKILRLVKSIRNRMCLTTIYSCGLRISEATNLQINDIDSKRMVVRIQMGKGGKDRYSPLPSRTLKLLREYWLMIRSKSWLFPSASGLGHISNTTIALCFKKVLWESGVSKPASVHTLRHSYATHLLENGVDLQHIQRILGHKSPKSTIIYTHLTQKGIKQLRQSINKLMSDL